MYVYNLANAFERVAERFSMKPALIFEEDSATSFLDLNTFANQIAGLLLSKGVCRGDVVCIAGNKEVLSFAALLACLKIGAPYAVLDDESPVVRLDKILTTCAPKVVLGKPEFIQSLNDLQSVSEATLLQNDDSLLDVLESFPGDNLSISSQVTADNPAYIMFTSGSTGFPKGAVMTHDNVLNFIAWGKSEFGVEDDDIFTNVNPLYFDNSVFDFYVSLFNGASLAPFAKKTVSQARLLVEQIDKIGCTSWFSVPSLLNFLLSNKALTHGTFPSMRRIIFGGEGFPKARLQKLYELYSGNTTFINVYGPTECTCICSSYVISDSDFEDLQGFPPLGSMIRNFDYQILDENRKLVEEGEAGELCLLGPNVGKGYYNDPERTAVAFVQNPQITSYSQLVYRTGDLVKYDPKDGKVYILGRVDNQIKHMGYRIELEEIENALCCLEYVEQAAVVHGERRGLSQILAVVQVNRAVELTLLKSDLREIIPNYMIPTDFKITDKALPKNPNGKIDRKTISLENFL